MLNNKKMIRIVVPFVVAALLLLLAACGSQGDEGSQEHGDSQDSGMSQETPLQEHNGSESETDAAEDDGTLLQRDVTVVLDWYPNTNHTGLYVALEEGFYEDEQLQVEIIQPGEGNTAEQLVASGRADFGISYQEAVTQSRAQDIPIVSIAAVIQHNTSAFASLAEDGIETVNDFEGKKYGGWGSPAEEAVLSAVMENAGADVSKVENIMLGSADFFQSVGRTVDFAWIYYGWDGIEAERRGMDLNIIMLKDLDPALDYYTPVIITSEDQIASDADVVERFLRAVSLGYEYSIDHPAEAADILLAHAPELNEELVRASQVWLSGEYQAEASQWGLQSGEVWERYADWMVERGLIPAMIDTEQAYTNEYLPK